MSVPIPIFFIWFLIAIFIFRHHMRKNSIAQAKVSDAFWKKEQESLVVRKKELLPEDYLHPTLSIEDFKDEAYYESIGQKELVRQADYLKSLVTQPMVNFSGVTNTDLRTTYGTAMITTIQAYEENFTAYTTTLYTMAEKVHDTGEVAYAIRLLEEGIKLGTDSRTHYLLLAACYKDLGDTGAMARLIERAKTLDSLTKESLLQDLKALIDES